MVARGRDRLAAAIDVTAGIGAGNLFGVLYSTLAKYLAPISGISRGHVVESVAWLADRTAQVGLTTSLEVVNRYETNVVNTVADMLTLTDEAGADLRVHLDTYHANIEENGFVESFSSAVVHPELGNMLAVWRNLWDDGRDLAQHAHRFMSEHLRR